MTYVPKPDGHNHNISHEPPLREFVRVAIVFTVVVCGLFGAAALLADVISAHVSPEQEIFLMKRVGALQGQKYSGGPMTDYLNDLVSRLQNYERGERYKYIVAISCETIPNAYAIPGGLIVVTAGLQDSVTSENGLAFVLAHEMGHFHNRDHLRSISRQFLFASLGALIGVSKIDAVLPMMINLSFSREQERRADIYGASLIRQEYGHLEGAADFFQFMLKSQPLEAKMPGFLSSHPVTAQRLQEMQSMSNDQIHGVQTPLRVRAKWMAECRHHI